MSTTKLLETMNSLANVKYSSGHWDVLRKQLIAINVSKKGLVSEGLVLLESINNRAIYFYFNLGTKQYTLGKQS
jgi:hypothetical protein